MADNGGYGSGQPAPVGLGILGAIGSGIKGYEQGVNTRIQRQVAAFERERQYALEQNTLQLGQARIGRYNALTDAASAKPIDARTAALQKNWEDDYHNGLSRSERATKYPGLDADTGEPVAASSTPAAPGPTGGAATPVVPPPGGNVSAADPNAGAAPVAAPGPASAPMAAATAPTPPVVPPPPSAMAQNAITGNTLFGNVPAPPSLPPSATLGQFATGMTNIPVTAAPPTVPPAGPAGATPTGGNVATPSMTGAVPSATPPLAPGGVTPSQFPITDINENPYVNARAQAMIKGTLASYQENLHLMSDPASRMQAYQASLANLSHYTENGQPIDPAKYGIFPPTAYPVPTTDKQKQDHLDAINEAKSLEDRLTNATLGNYGGRDADNKHYQDVFEKVYGYRPAPIPVPGLTPDQIQQGKHQADSLAQQEIYHKEDEQDKADSRGLESAKLAVSEGELALNQATKSGNDQRRIGAAVALSDSYDHQIGLLRAKQSMYMTPKPDINGTPAPGQVIATSVPTQSAKAAQDIETSIQALSQERRDKLLAAGLTPEMVQQYKGSGPSGPPVVPSPPTRTKGTVVQVSSPSDLANLPRKTIYHRPGDPVGVNRVKQ